MKGSRTNFSQQKRNYNQNEDEDQEDKDSDENNYQYSYPQDVHVNRQSEEGRVDLSVLERIEEIAWLGEDDTHRTSARTSSLDKEPSLFNGISKIDDAARSLNALCLVCFFHQAIKGAFDGMCLIMRDIALAKEEDFKLWAAFKCISKGDSGRSKDQRAFWEYAFYEDRRDEYNRLKWSLAHPCRHFTQHALDNSWEGVRNYLGQFEKPKTLRTPDMPHIFGIVEAQ